jgi:hypothetical protein
MTDGGDPVLPQDRQRPSQKTRAAMMAVRAPATLIVDVVATSHSGWQLR